MLPVEHRAKAEELLSSAWSVEEIARAQVHATLALAPPPPVQPSRLRWSLDKSHAFPDATGGKVAVLPVKNGPGVILSFADDAALLENPDILRNLASLLTAHADRLESRS